MKGEDIGIIIWIGGYLFIALIYGIIYLLPEGEEEKRRRMRREDYFATLNKAKKLTKEVMDALK